MSQPDFLSEFKKRDRWMVWRTEARVDGEKPTKVPHCSRGGYGSSTSSDRWSSYTEAVAASRNYEGVGYAMGDGHTLIDLDDCRDPLTGVIDDWAKEIVEYLKCPTEVSPSGRGLHCYVKCAALRSLERRFATTDRPKRGIEVYFEGRYSAVTFQHLPGTPVVIPATDLTEFLELVKSGFFDPQDTGTSRAWGENVTRDWKSLVRSTKLNLAEWLQKNHVEVLQECGDDIYTVTCPGSHGVYDKSDGKAFVMQLPSGALAMGCQHSSCSFTRATGNHWKEFRDAVEGPRKQDGPKIPPMEFKHPARKGKVRECVLLSIFDGDYDGWFGRGRVHLINGSSGSGKTTLMVDLLVRQRKGETYLDHAGAGLPFLIVFADRGDLSNQETLQRMHLEDAGLNIEYLDAICSGKESARAILDMIETQETIPPVVFVEGGDLLVEDATKATDVAPFMHALQKIASHYHIAIILSVGCGKSRPKDAYTNHRDRTYGSEKWARMSDTILALGTPPGTDDTESRRVLKLLHRNAKAETYRLIFSDGLLMRDFGEEKLDTFSYWCSVRDWFTMVDALTALKGEICKATLYRKKDAALQSGLLEQKTDEENGGFLYRWVKEK